MRLFIETNSGKLTGLCEACGSPVAFEFFEDNQFGFYSADDIVNKWMDHQLNECPSVVIDNPSGIS